MSLNRKRRIFRPTIGPAPRIRVDVQQLGVALAAIGGVATMVLVTWLFVRSNEAPALARPTAQIAAAASDLAVVDGDTLRLGRQVVRLTGIEAPARGKACGAVDCGTAAANALAALVQGRGVDCAIFGSDRYGRPMGVCRASGVDLNAALVRDGWAYATDRNLRPTEEDARRAGRGIWRAGSTPNL